MVPLAGKCKFNLRAAPAGDGAGARLPEGAGGALRGPDGPRKACEPGRPGG
jgi:hypothetical protein